MTVCLQENITLSTENHSVCLQDNISINSENHPVLVQSESTQSNTCDLDELFYESVSLSEKLGRYVSECQGFLLDEEFKRERDQCEEVLDQQIPEIAPPTKPKEPEPPKETPKTRKKPLMSHEISDAPDDEHVTEEMKVSRSSSVSSLTCSDLELSDELTEVSSTDSISNPSDKESIDLEIDDYNFKDCSITRRVNPRPPAESRKVSKKEISEKEKTRIYLNQVDKKVSCKCCRSVMGRIVHEVRQCEKAVIIANIKPYQPKTSLITNVKSPTGGSGFPDPVREGMVCSHHDPASLEIIPPGKDQTNQEIREDQR
ncbi:uncharacterized protein LOC134817577 isoform X2 [Bolinopsis microptera]|uniref:uncharacterized protein LOC134817577 isoform X2 n=1 Tax=Bolinopsis microptera TaxID=2820187 RepID=UPI00307A2BB9